MWILGTTYDTLENRFRPLKKLAEELKTGVNTGERSEMRTPSRTKSASSPPRKPKTPQQDPLGSEYHPWLSAQVDLLTMTQQ